MHIHLLSGKWRKLTSYAAGGSRGIVNQRVVRMSDHWVDTSAYYYTLQRDCNICNLHWVSLMLMVKASGSCFFLFKMEFRFICTAVFKLEKMCWKNWCVKLNPEKKTCSDQSRSNNFEETLFRLALLRFRPEDFRIFLL